MTQDLVADACASTTGQRLRVGPTSVAKTAVLFDGTRAGSCLRDLVCAGSRDVRLGPVSWDDDGCAGRQLAVFAPGFAPQRRAYPAAIPSEVQLPAPSVIPVKLWAVAKSAETGAILARGLQDLAVAAERLDALASGVRLRYGVAARVPTDAASSAQADAIGNRCGVITASLGRDQPDARRSYYAAPDTLNVYYVASVAPECPDSNPNCYGDEGSGSSGWLHGISCATDDPTARGHPEILFVSGELASRAETLLHEIGHSLGLIRPAWGHTNGLEDFPERTGNLMYDGVNIVQNITVGQLWRLHFEPTSWLFPPGVESAFRACQQDPHADVPCPPLALRPRQPWP